jgi:hypothetical protein
LASDIKAGPPSSTSTASYASTGDSSASDSSSTSTTSTDQATLAAVTNIQIQHARDISGVKLRVATSGSERLNDAFELVLPTSH